MADVQSIAVVGGGLVGALQTIFMTKKATKFTCMRIV